MILISIWHTYFDILFLCCFVIVTLSKCLSARTNFISISFCHWEEFRFSFPQKSMNLSHPDLVHKVLGSFHTVSRTVNTRPTVDSWWPFLLPHPHPFYCDSIPRLLSTPLASGERRDFPKWKKVLYILDLSLEICGKCFIRGVNGHCNYLN